MRYGIASPEKSRKKNQVDSKTPMISLAVPVPVHVGEQDDGVPVRVSRGGALPHQAEEVVEVPQRGGHRPGAEGAATARVKHPEQGAELLGGRDPVVEKKKENDD